ncbi:MAG: cation:proton antiporter [Flavobacteriales bacterium]|nr:cation:proton antiporter [Flavobacteriales bacterium]
MATEHVLILLGGLVVFSYIFDLFAKRARVPSVLLLLALGVALREISVGMGFPVLATEGLLPTLGTVGLILIVFDGALELEYSPERRGVILRALLASVAGLLLVGAAYTVLLHGLSGAPWRACLANAVPFSVISSAVAIPSAAGLPKARKEFIIYESSISDILGVVAFNLFATSGALDLEHFGGTLFDLLIVVVISLLSCAGLLWLLSRSTHNVRVFLILALLMMVYGLGKSFHLSSLIIILVFGLFMANLTQIPLAWLHRMADYPRAAADRELLHALTRESTFIVRTFFFVLFGYSISLATVLRGEVWIIVGALLGLLYASRAVVLAVSMGRVDPATLVLAPRGLITVLLFLSLPADLRITQVDLPLVVAMVLGTAVVMALVLPLVRMERKP